MKRDRTVIWHRVLTFRGLLPLMVAVLTLSMISCIKESPILDEQPDKDYMDFSLELTPPGGYTAATKAMSDAQQNAINRAEVLVFQNNKLLYHETGIFTIVDGVRKVKVKLKTSQTETDLFDIMVIGNPPAGFDFPSYVGKTKDELKATFNVSAAGKWNGSEFIMYGEALQKLIKPATNNFKIQMLRSLARVDVGVGAYNAVADTWAGLADFKLTEVKVVNSRDKFAAIPSATTFNESGYVKVSAPTIPAGTAVQGKNAATAISYTGADITQTNVSTKSTIFIAEAPNTTDKVSLLIGGSYKGGSTTFYRVDMCVPNAGAPGSYDYLNILRNHLYRITVAAVNGAGFASAQEALNATPMNIVVDMTATPEGDAGGDIIFDGQSFIMTDVSSVTFNTFPNGSTSFDLFNVKASFPSGVTANVTGPGISTPIALTSDVSKLISAVIPASIASGEYTITVGRLIKKIKLILPTRTSVEVDAHFDVLPYMNVASMTIINPQPWITLSQNMIYLPSEQQSASIVGNAQKKAYIHFDENIATSGAFRKADVLVSRTDGTATLVTVTQRNLSGMVLGFFGGGKDQNGYLMQVAVEAIEENIERVYDDKSIGSPNLGIPWGFAGIEILVNDKVNGRAGTFTLSSKQAESGISGPYTIYNNYAARYCYDKNRDADGSGAIEDKELKWYLPAQHQMMLLWVARNGMTIPSSTGDINYWSVTENGGNNGSWLVGFLNGVVSSTTRSANRVRCIREV